MGKRESYEVGQERLSEGAGKNHDGTGRLEVIREGVEGDMGKLWEREGGSGCAGEGRNDRTCI